MANPLGWARTTPGNIVEPPEAKKDNGWNPGEPAAAEYLNWWMNEVGKKFGARILADANVVLTSIDLFRPLIQTPTANRVITLPSASVGAGASVNLHNLATAQKFTIESSDGDDICQFQNGSMRLMALQDTPTDRTHWRILDVYGGASPRFSVRKLVQSNVTGEEKIIWDSGTEEYDNNDDFDYTDNRFIPKIPGAYSLIVTLGWSLLTAGDGIRVLFKKNGTSELSITLQCNDTSWVLSGAIELEADGIADYFEIYGRNLDRTTSRIDAGESTFIGHRISS